MEGRGLDEVECVVVGAGVVGLAAARALAQAGREVVVAEREGLIGSHTSARNSEVIHAGIYYPPGSLMARLCVEGRERLYGYCEAHNIPHRRIGKLIVASDAAEASRLDAIAARAKANGVSDLEPLSGAEARALEPHLAVEAALLSPSTGIVDSHALMLALSGDAEAAGAAVALNAPLESAEITSGGFALRFGGAEPMQLHARSLVNASGPWAPEVAGRIDGFPAEHLPRAFYARGSYFTLSGRSPFSQLVYPVPVPGGLGTHLTLDLAGQARFGPDVEWVEGVDYSVDPGRLGAFASAIRRFWPDLDESRLQPGYAGIRPKIAGPGEPQRDFLLQGPATHGVPGLVNLFGIESPGLTASLALADRVVEALGERP
ncbi:MAG: FAD-dependent oxidoreductase [Mesorhizobium amorphae]|nr:MAG: FAD-dependent oxidoreductase [Mesorhizobium amorphae]